MIVTKSWLNEWIDLADIPTDTIAKTFNSIGLEVDKIDEFRVPSKIVFGRVLECEKHPDADKLNICQVDIGSSVRQIVCGASNVRAGLDVVVATIGAVMPSGMAIKPVKLRGVDSEGMICSASEIGLVDCQAGILELDDSIGTYTLGQEVCENKIFNDDLIEIELTANRGDCLSIRGVARDLSASFDRSIIERNFLDNEDKRIGIGRVLSISHPKGLNVDLRYKVVDLNEMKIPLLVRLRLAQIGEVFSSNIEAFMFYSTHTSGVILRAYKHQYFCSQDDTLAKIELVEDKSGYACVMSSDNKASTVGVKQIEESKVSEDKGLVLLEASYIPPDIISKQMSVNKIEAGPMFYKTSRGSEPELNIGLSFCLGLITDNSSSAVYGGNIEVVNSYNKKVVTISKDDIDDIIGANIDKVRITNILKNLGFETSKSSTDNIVVSVPQYRHDISHKQDIIEEIVRMVGIDNIPSKPFIFTEKNRLEDDYFEYKKKSIFRHKASQSGFFEAIHFVFDEEKVLKKYGFKTITEDKQLLNPIVSTLDTLRPTLLTGLLKSANLNKNNGYKSIRLFEIGSVFDKNRVESLKMAMIFSGDKESENLSNAGKASKIDFATFTQKIADIVGDFELSEYETKHTLSHNYQSAEVIIDGVVVGELFRVHPTVENEYDLENTYLCEFDFEKLPYCLKTAKITSKYQAVTRDLSIIMPKMMSYENLRNSIDATKIKELINFTPVDRYSDETLGENVSLSLRFTLQSSEKTLGEDDINKAMDTILKALGDDLGIGLR